MFHKKSPTQDVIRFTFFFRLFSLTAHNLHSIAVFFCLLKFFSCFYLFYILTFVFANRYFRWIDSDWFVNAKQKILLVRNFANWARHWADLAPKLSERLMTVSNGLSEQNPFRRKRKQLSMTSTGLSSCAW